MSSEVIKIGIFEDDHLQVSGLEIFFKSFGIKLAVSVLRMRDVPQGIRDMVAAGVIIALVDGNLSSAIKANRDGKEIVVKLKEVGIMSVNYTGDGRSIGADAETGGKTSGHGSIKDTVLALARQ